MAQPIYCDYAGCQDPEAARARFATWMIQRLDGTLAEAYCDEHYPIMAVASAQAVAGEAGRELGDYFGPPVPGPDDPTDSDDPKAQESDSPQEATERPQEPETVPEAPGPTEAATEAEGPESAAPAGPTVVRRGTSRSRKAFEGRKRERAREAQEATE